MQTFASQVLVLSPSGEYVFRAHAERAKRMVQDGEAVIVPGERRKSVRRIALRETTAYHRRGRASQVNIRSYMGQSYTFRERIRDASGDVVATVTQLKHIDTRDYRVFVLSVLDCLSEPARKRAEEYLRAEHARRN